MIKESNAPSLALLFSSFDKNYDIWSITAHFMQKYWPECPYPIYLGANGADRTQYIPKNWEYINKGADKSWSESLIQYLSAIPDSHVLLLVDDTALTAHPDNNEIKKTLEFMNQNNAVMCRLGPHPGPDKIIQPPLGRVAVAKGVPYITSWTNVIWEKSFLLQLLGYNYNPWEFEILAGKTPIALDRATDFYASSRHLLPYWHFVEKGKFDPHLKKIAKKEKLTLSSREFISYKNYFLLKLKYYFSKVQYIIPNRYLNKCRQLLGLKVL